MSFSKIWPSGLSYGEIVTHGQLNDLDEDHVNSLDKSSGSTDTLESDVTVSGGGSITISNAGTLTVDADGIASVAGSCTFENGSTTLFDVSSSLTISCDVEFDGDCDAVFNGGTCSFVGAAISIDGTSTLTTAGTTTITAASGLTLTHASGGVTLATRTVTKAASSYVSPDAAVWTFSTSYLCWRQISTSTTEMVAELDLPNGVTLTTVTSRILPPSGHLGLPANKPNLSVYKIDVSTGVPTQLGSTTTDAPANVPAYELAHTLTVSGLSSVVDRSAYRYVVLARGESSTNALTGLQIISINTTYTTTSYSLG